VRHTRAACVRACVERRAGGGLNAMKREKEDDVVGIRVRTGDLTRTCS
jgi:hypothetical protein